MSVEIYSKGRPGTKDQPLAGNQYATFSARINGTDASRLQGYGYQWSSNPPYQAFGADVKTVSFQLPDIKRDSTVRINLKLSGGGISDTYGKVFHVVPKADEEPEPEEVMKTVNFTDGDPKRGEYPEGVFESARKRDIVYKYGLFYRGWFFSGTQSEFEQAMGFGEPEPAPIGLPSNKPESDTEHEPGTETSKSNREKAIDLLDEAKALLEADSG